MIYPEKIIDDYKKETNNQKKLFLADTLMRMIIHYPETKWWKFIQKDVPGEIWRPLSGFDGFYEISNYGRLKLLTYIKGYSKKGNPIIRKEKIKEFRKDYSCFYPHTTIVKGGKFFRVHIHVLVAKHFVPNPYNKPFVNHLDGDKCNNHYKNLEWATVEENNTHARSTGLNNAHSENHELAKLNNKQVMQIFSSNESNKDLSIKYDVHIATIQGIKRGSSWSKVTGKVHKGKKKLNKVQVIDIYNSNLTQTALAKKYGVTQGCIWYIKKGISYPEITKSLNL